MTMTTAAAQVDLEPPVLDEPALAEDIVDECGLGSFPASDPPSWWAAGLRAPAWRRPKPEDGQTPPV
jgi:hypothetical protein